MKRLFVSGDSWTAGYDDISEIENRSSAWPKIISDKINATLIDSSESGASNHRIYRKAFDALLMRACDVAIVEFGRIDYYELGCGEMGNITQHIPALGYTVIDKELCKKHNNAYFYYTNLLRMVVSIQTLAESVNIPTFFLDTSVPGLSPEITYESFLNLIGKDSEIFKNSSDSVLLSRYQVVKNINDNINYSKFLLSGTMYAELPSDQMTACRFNGKLYLKNYAYIQHPTKQGHSTLADRILQRLQSEVKL